MPRQEFIALRGLSPRIELAVLESVQGDSWFSVPSALNEDPLAVEVRVGIYRQYHDTVFVDQTGRALDILPVVAEALAVGPRLAALRQYVDHHAGGRSELVGYLHDPQLIPRVLLLIYRVMMATPAQVGSAGAWLAPSKLSSVIAQPLERLALGVA